ncbi:hypothetical protein ACH5RR_012614 [Cinchona calisaya]|uniref:Uncharacterized protein n=1 Tax=Cinchona calisaya TaxID=153742 RepID=A0ABD3AE22_9GENT
MVKWPSGRPAAKSIISAVAMEHGATAQALIHADSVPGVQLAITAALLARAVVKASPEKVDRDQGSSSKGLHYNKPNSARSRRGRSPTPRLNPIGATAILSRIADSSLSLVAVVETANATATLESIPAMLSHQTARPSPSTARLVAGLPPL